MNSQLRKEILKEINFLLQEEEKDTSFATIAKDKLIEVGGLISTGAILYKLFEKFTSGGITEYLFVREFIKTPGIQINFPAPTNSDPNRMLQFTLEQLKVFLSQQQRNIRDVSVAKYYAEEARKAAEAAFREAGKIEFKRLVDNNLLQQEKPGLYKFSQLGTNFLNLLRTTYANVRVNLPQIIQGLKQIGQMSVPGILVGAANYGTAGIATAAGVTLAIGAGVAIGSTAGYITNKLINAYGGSYASFIKKIQEKSKNSLSYTMEQINEFIEKGGIDYEEGSEENPTWAGAISFGRKTRGEPKGFFFMDRLGKGNYNVKDGVIIFSLLNNLFFVHKKAGEVEDNGLSLTKDPDIIRSKDLYLGALLVLEILSKTNSNVLNLLQQMGVVYSAIGLKEGSRIVIIGKPRMVLTSGNLVSEEDYYKQKAKK